MQRLLLAFLLPFGCSSSSTTVARLPDGSWHLTCKSSLGGCVRKAEQICKEQSYDVLRGRNEHRLYGHELGKSQVVADRSELVVRCAGTKAPSSSAPAQGAPAPAKSVPTAKRKDTPAAAASQATSVCTKGATQACVGPAACAGGQVCLADGSGFGPCDCGPSQSPATTP